MNGSQRNMRLCVGSVHSHRIPFCGKSAESKTLSYSQCVSVYIECIYMYRWIRWMRSYCSLTHCLDLDFVKRKATLDHSDMSVIYNRLGWYRIASEDNEHAGDTRLIQDSQVIRTYAHHYHHPETSPKPARNQPEWVIYLYDTHTESYSDGWPVIFFICKLIVIDFMCTFCSGQQWRWQG